MVLKKDYLYYIGNTYDDVTGGWKASTTLNTSWVATQSGKVTFNETNMVASVKYTNSDSLNHQAIGMITTVDKIDLTNYNSLFIKCAVDVNDIYSVYARIGVFSNKQVGGPDIVKTKYITKDTSEKLYKIDISSLTGSYYIGFWLGHSNHGGSASVTVSEVYLSY